MAAIEALFHKGFRRGSAEATAREKRTRKAKRTSSDLNKVMAMSSEESEGPSPNHVSYLGEDMETLPVDFIQKYSSIAKRLDLSYNRLKSVQGLAEFKALEELVLDNNDLGDEALVLMPALTRVHTLSLNKNQIEDCEKLLDRLKTSCPVLRYLSLLGNAACPNPLLGRGHDDDDYRRYRLYVLYRLPHLKFLDSSKVTDEERKEAKRVGQFMKVVKPTGKQPEDDNDDELTVSETQHYTPLPSNDPNHKGKAVFGNVKYIYHGKHSEGNRFIRNSQL